MYKRQHVFIVSASGDQKPRFLANFDTFGRSCTDPLIPMRSKFGVLEHTQGLHLPAKFHLHVFIVSASNGQKPQCWANFDIWGLRYRLPFIDDSQNLVCYSRPTVYAYILNFVSISLFCRPLLAKNPNFAVFGL